MPEIRTATVQDAENLLNIYAQYIETAVTFEYRLPTKDEFAERIAGIVAEYPYLLWEQDGKTVGYAYAHRHMERSAYQWNAELSVYLDHRYTSQGIGKKLYQVLMELLKLQGVKTVYGGVTVPNVKSERLHLGLGFVCLGTYHNTGYKCGKWHDVAWYEKNILPYGSHPPAVIPFREISQETVRTVIETFHGKS